MDLQTVGWLSIVPPFVAITLAIVTKEVLISLALGIFCGALILTGGNPATAFTKSVEILIESIGDAEWNVRVILFVMLLGGIVGLLARSGSPISFSQWAVKKSKEPTPPCSVYHLGAGRYYLYGRLFQLPNRGHHHAAHYRPLSRIASQAIVYY